MGTTPLPNNGGLLIGLAIKMKNGITTIGGGVPITMLTAVELQTALDAFTIQDNGFNTARSVRLTESLAYQATTGEVYTWLLAARKVLAIHLGNPWSTAWAQAGFINNSTAIPTKVPEQLSLALAVGSFLTANPVYEAPTLKITAAQASLVRTAALAAGQTLTFAELDLKTSGQTWTTAYEALVALMRTLIRNLQGKLGKDDPRWLAFGLQMPGTNTTPGKPLDVSVQTDEFGTPLAQCTPVSLATRYRCRARIFGVEGDYRLVTSSKEPLMTLPLGQIGQPGQTLEIIIQAVNGNLQGVASDPLLYSIPMSKGQSFAVVPPLIVAPAGQNGGSSHGTNGNGSNGSNGSHRNTAAHRLTTAV